MMQRSSVIQWTVLFFFMGVASLSAYAMDNTRLLRGAQTYTNYCAGCHALKYMRYNRLASDLGLDEKDLLAKGILNSKAQFNGPILVALNAKEAQEWFGALPPDLSLMAKEKGVVWLRDYLTGFYPDEHRPFGTNNRWVPDVAMPAVLPMPMKEDLLEDLLAFLAYVAEPDSFMRYSLAFFVFPFLGLLFFLLWGLKRVYWRQIQ